MTISLGLAGALGPERIARLAAAAEDAGFTSLWVNDTPDGDAIAALGAAARTTERLTLATGVVPVDRRSARSLVAAVRAVDLPLDRVVLGIGSGASREGALTRVRDAVAELRGELSCRIVVGALGPRMRRLGVVEADGVVLNWLTPGAAAAQTAELRAASPATADAERRVGHNSAIPGAEGRSGRGSAGEGSGMAELCPVVALYVRTALDPAAFGRLREETARYASSPNYAANFARLGIDAADTVIEGQDALRRRIPQYADAVDEVVLRAITPGDEDADYLAFIDRARVIGS